MPPNFIFLTIIKLIFVRMQGFYMIFLTVIGGNGKKGP